jgi:hypothetical protein
MKSNMQIPKKASKVWQLILLYEMIDGPLRNWRSNVEQFTHLLMHRLMTPLLPMPG